ncbi:MAG: 50S ribosomal protein L4 [Candidatus Levybacteria bacterium]|nr:50S ribosomal protein L4 [Candidatus Levybacteria bacterium]
MPAKKLKVKSSKLKVAKKNIKAPKIVVKKSAKKAKIEAKIPVLAKTKGAGLNASVFDTKGKVSGSISLPTEVFGAKINDSLMAQAVRVYLANQRQGTVKTKDRGEVNKTTKKVWQQKGTGRARHGSKRAPIFVGGGLAFGPRPRDFSLSLSKKMKTLALFSALSSKLKDNELKIVKGLEEITPKTQLMAQVLENLGIKNASRVLLVMPKAKEAENVYRAARNIEGVEILTANMINAYKVIDNKLILLMRDAVDVIEDTFMKGPHNDFASRGKQK